MKIKSIPNRPIADEIFNLSFEIRNISLETRHNLYHHDMPLSYTTEQMSKIWELAKKLTDIGLTLKA